MIINLFSFNVDLFQNVNVNNGTLVQHLVVERVPVICFNMLRLQELKQEQEFGICKYARSRSLLSLSRSGVGVSKKQTLLTSGAQPGLGIDTQKSKEIIDIDSSPKSKEIIDFDGSFKK